MARNQEAQQCDVTHGEGFNTVKKYLVSQKTSDLYNTHMHILPSSGRGHGLFESIREVAVQRGGVAVLH